MTRAAIPSDMELIETFALRDAVPQHLPRHLDRLESSARYFGFRIERERIGEGIAHLQGTALVRLRLGRDGTFVLEPRSLLPLPAPVRLAVDTEPIDPASPFVQHKTTIRDHYASARARHPDADDVVLVNPAGRITETTIANLAVQLDGHWFTPPLTDGCLPGIGRGLALERGEVTERSIAVSELPAAEAIALVSSARGWRRAVR